MVVKHGVPGHRNGKHARKLAQPGLDPLLAVGFAFSKQECPAHTAGDAVIPASDGTVDKMSAGHGHDRKTPEEVPRAYPNAGSGRKITMRVLVLTCRSFRHQLRSRPGPTRTRSHVKQKPPGPTIIVGPGGGCDTAALSHTRSSHQGLYFVPLRTRRQAWAPNPKAPSPAMARVDGSGTTAAERVRFEVIPDTSCVLAPVLAASVKPMVSLAE